MEFSQREADLGDTEDAYGTLGNIGGTSSAPWGAGRDYMDF